jgi:peroxiredoxin
MAGTGNEPSLGEDKDLPGVSPAMPATPAQAFALATARDCSLKERLDTYSAYSRQLGPEINEAYDELIEKLGRLKNAGPSPGSLMPDFGLPDQNGHLVSLGSLLAEGPLVLSFNRGHWCPWCRLELRGLAAIHGELQQLGAQVVSIIPETQAYSARLAADNQLPFKVLTDLDLGYTLSLGLMIWAGEKIRALYTQAGLDLALFHNNDGWFLPIPATFIIGCDGIVKAKTTDPDFRKRMEPQEILAALCKAR